MPPEDTAQDAAKPESTELLTAAEADAAFSGGFQDVEHAGEDAQTDENPPAQRAEASETTEESSPETPATPEPEFVQLTKTELAELKAGVSKVQALEAALTKHGRDTSGRIGGLEQTLKEIKSAAQSGTAPDISEEDFEELKAEYPDLAKLVVAGMGRAAKKTKGASSAPVIDAAQISEIVNQVVDTRVPLHLTQREEDGKRKEFDKIVPGWRDIVKSPGWASWLGTQSPDYQEQVKGTWDHDVLVPAFKKYKASIAPPSAPPSKPATPRRDRFAESAVPKSAGGVSTKKEEDPFTEGFREARKHAHTY